MKLCPIQEVCRKFKTGDNKPPNNDVRDKYPCKSFLDMSCDMGLRLQEWIDGPVACNLEKIRRIKKELK